ncbi:hypothetical protein SUDANB176_07671 (plasmid) [Streptomyces sp. enrichment culture]|uniref:hypothetical protein n=1 Tax=Streptomyces sp. enrichment culture TaxID=1795815 RepID=UPI003F570591
MTDAASAAGAEDAFTAVLAEGNQLLDDLGLTWDRLLDVRAVSFATGVALERVAARLAGEPADTARRPFSERLLFLKKTRLDARGKEYSTRAISAGTSHAVTQGGVHHLLSGRNEPGREVAAALERFFGVQVGWCSLSEGEALASYVGPLVRQLKTVKTLADLQARGVQSVVARSAPGHARGPELLEALLPTLLAELGQDQPPVTDK